MTENRSPARPLLRAMAWPLLIAAVALIVLIFGARMLYTGSVVGATPIDRVYSNDPRVLAYDQAHQRPLSPFRGYPPSRFDDSTTPITWYYTLHLAEAPTQHWAVLQPGAHAYTVLAANGTVLSDPSMGGLLRPYFRHHPVLTRIPATMLRAGANRIEFQLRPYDANDLWLDMRRPSIGLEHDLHRAYSTLHRFKVTSLDLINILMLMIAALALTLWLLRPPETLYGYYALGILGWLAFNQLYSMNYPPVSPYWLHYWGHVGLAVSLLALLFFVHRLGGFVLPRLERAAVAGTVVAVVGLTSAYLLLDLLTATQVRNQPFRFWLLLIGGYIAGFLLFSVRRSDTLESRWLAAGGFFCIGIGVNDSLAMLVIGAPHPLLFQYCAFVAAVTFMIIILRRFVGALDRAEQMNVELDAKVQEKSDQLQRSFAERQKLERANLLSEERRRIMTDMHDGIGGQLVALLAGIRRGKHDPATTETAVSAALGDLRLMIDSLDDATGDVAVALGVFRARTDPRIREAGLATAWDTASIPEGTLLAPRKILLLFRVLQEAIANVIKHANARTLRVSARLDAAQTGALLRIEVRDDGIGMPQPLVPGRGIGNLTQRARQLGGSISWHDADPGTECRLEVPLSSLRA